MNRRPRVTAQHQIQPVSMAALCQELDDITPGVTVAVSFDLHDHETALSLLEQAVTNVRAQIEETHA